MSRGGSSRSDLLGEVVSQGNFPDTILLPDTILTHSEKAVEKTMRDGRERSIRLLHSRRWTAGRTYAGRALEVTKAGALQASVSRTADLIGTILRPEIFMHTHPSPDEAIIEKYIAYRAAAKGWSDEERELRKESLWAHAKASYPFPSSPDIQHTYGRSQGRVGNMVCSDQGRVLWIPREPGQDASLIADLADLTNTVLSPYPTTRRAVEKTYARQIANEMVAVEQGDSEAMRDAYGRVTASVLAPRYVCYMSMDLADPALHRVDA